MNIRLTFLAVIILLISCNLKQEQQKTTPVSMVGTWRLLSGTLIEKGDTTVTDYTKNVSFIKIINPTHFAFLKHNTNTPKDSSEAYDSGGGRYSLSDSSYTEHLDYCNEKEWEGHEFTFTVSIQNDTLTQTGIEKLDNAGINRLNIERYVKMKD